MIDHAAFIVKVLDGTVVKFFESAFESDDDVLRFLFLRLIQAAVTVSENTLDDISAIQVAILQQKLCIAQLHLKVALRVHFEEVSASDFFAFWRHAALFEAVLSIHIVDGLCLD